jgi:hypothetical protein
LFYQVYLNTLVANLGNEIVENKTSWLKTSCVIAIIVIVLTLIVGPKSFMEFGLLPFNCVKKLFLFPRPTLASWIMKTRYCPLWARSLGAVFETNCILVAVISIHKLVNWIW